MNVFTGIVVYLLVWMLTLFTVLPWRAEPEANPERGHAPSAPANPRLGMKFLITTGIAAIIWAVIFALVQVGVIDFHAIAEEMAREDGL